VIVSGTFTCCAGNAGEENAVLDVKCWIDQNSVVVKVIDISPCW
jgi:hypothetical protein